jgi:spoIIIJ-associated protein
MSECYEFEGKTVEKAVQKACETLNLPKESLSHEVISYGSSGIFGLVGVKKARIRVCQEAPAQADGSDVETSARDMADEGLRHMGEEGPREGSGRSDARTDPAELGRELIQKIIDSMTTGAAIRVAGNDGHLKYDIQGGNLGIMIGKRGQTLEAIHYLVEKIINKKCDQRVRIDIDVGGYLENRRQNLKQLALRMAKKARQSGKPVTVGQMNAQDRRIIHLAVRDDSSVRTQSIGEGYLRKLIIFPKRCPQGKASGPRGRRAKKEE